PHYFCISCLVCPLCILFKDPATSDLYTLSLHDALPISSAAEADDLLTETLGGLPVVQPVDDDIGTCARQRQRRFPPDALLRPCQDRKSTRLNSSHVKISYAVFCLKKKTKQDTIHKHIFL